MKSLILICSIVLSLSTKATDDSGQEELASLLGNSSLITVELAGSEMSLAAFLAANMNRIFSPSGDATYMTNEFNNTCNFEKDTSFCMLTILNATKTYQDGAEHTMTESSYLLKYEAVEGKVITSKITIDVAG